MNSEYYVVFLIIAGIFVGGIFFFNLDDKVFGIINFDEKNEIQIQETIEENIIPIYFESNDAELEIQNTPTKVMMPEQNQVTNNEFYSKKLDEYKKQKEQKLKEKESTTIKASGKNLHYLEGSGGSWQNAKHLTNPVKMHLVFKPIDEYNEKFELIEGNLVIGNSNYNFKNGHLDLSGFKINLVLGHSKSTSPYAEISGSIEPFIDGSSNASIVIQDQLFFVSNKNTPIHLNIYATLSSNIL